MQKYIKTIDSKVKFIKHLVTLKSQTSVAVSDKVKICFENEQ